MLYAAVMNGRVVVDREERERERNRRSRVVDGFWGVEWVRKDSRPEENAKEPRGRAESERTRRCKEGLRVSLGEGVGVAEGGEGVGIGVTAPNIFTSLSALPCPYTGPPRPSEAITPLPVQPAVIVYPAEGRSRLCNLLSNQMGNSPNPDTQSATMERPPPLLQRQIEQLDAGLRGTKALMAGLVGLAVGRQLSGAALRYIQMSIGQLIADIHILFMPMGPRKPENKRLHKKTLRST